MAGPDDAEDPTSSALAPRRREDPPPREPADPALVAEFTAFYREAVPRLVAFLRWQGARLPDARDCVQDTMILALRHWPELREPYAWSRLVAARRYARLLATVREDPVEDPQPATGHALGADTELAALEERHAVLRCLDRLPSRQRQVMAWTYDGAAPAEIADALRITAEAVRANLYKARAALRGHLEGTGGEVR